jgi:hypothetical protein
MLYTRFICGDGMITAVGGNGGNATSIYNCGGGGGGGGGIVILCTKCDMSNSPITVSVAGGTGGLGYGTGANGIDGATGIMRIFCA